MKAPSLLKKIIAALSSKTNELRIRIMIFFLLHKNIDKSSLTNSLHALISHHPHHRHHHQKKKHDNAVEEDDVLQHLVGNGGEEDEEEGTSKATMMMHYNKAATTTEIHNISRQREGANDEEEPARDLTTVLFKESEAEMEMEMEGEAEEAVDGRRAAVGTVGDVEEEDIDQAADLFIQRFKRQIQLQKQLSLERHQTWLHTNA